MTASKIKAKKTQNKKPAKKISAKADVMVGTTINPVEWFTGFLNESITKIETIEHPETVSENLPKILDVLKTVQKTPFQKIEHAFSSLSRSVMASHKESAELSFKNEAYKRDNARFEKANAELREQVVESRKQIASSRDEAEAVYQDRLASLKDYEIAIASKDEAANRKLNAAERLNREAKNIQKDAKERLERAAKKRIENENYSKTITSQTISMKKQKDALDLAHERASKQGVIFAKNKKEIAEKVEELDAKKRELLMKESDILKSFGEARKKLGAAKMEEQSIKKRNLDADMKLKQADKTVLESKRYVRSAEVVAKRLETKYGIKGVLDFAKEKEAIIKDHVHLKAAAQAYQIMVREAKKRGWSDGEVDIPVFQKIGDNEFVKKLRETV